MANATKAELQAQLTELNISFPEDATAKELAALLPAAPDEDADGKTEARVIDQSSGNVIRTYTLKEHGETFIENAQSYAKKVSGAVKLH